MQKSVKYLITTNQSWITQKFCEDKDFKLCEVLEEPLSADLQCSDYSVFESKSKQKVSDETITMLKEAEIDGQVMVASYISYRTKKFKGQNLGAFRHTAKPEHVEPKFLKCLNRGGMTLPTRKWLKDYKGLSKIFQSHHPKDSLRTERGLFSLFFLKIKEAYPIYDDKTLHLVTRLLTRLRVNHMNEQFAEQERQKKAARSKKKCPVTLRGRLQHANRM